MIDPLWPTLVEQGISIDFTIDKVLYADRQTIIWSN